MTPSSKARNRSSTNVPTMAAILARYRFPPPCTGGDGLSKEAVVLLDAEDRIRAIGPASAALVVASPTDLIGRPARTVPLFDTDAFATLSDHARTQGPAHADLTHPDTGRRYQARGYASDDDLLAIYALPISPPVDASSPAAPSDSVEEERQRLQMALDGADLGAWELDLESGRTVYSERWAEILGYTLDEVDDTVDFFFRHVHPDDREQVREAVKACMQREQDMMDLMIRMRHKDGSWRWILDRGRILEWEEDGSPRRMVGTHMDVSDRKQAREALRRERNLLRRIFDASPAAIVVVNSDGVIVRSSKRVQEVLGVPTEDVNRRRFNDPAWDIHTVDGERMPDEELPFSRVMKEGRPVYELEHTVRWPDGQQRLLSISGAPLYGEVEVARGPDPEAAEETSATGAVFVIHDVTDERRAERALRHSEERFRAVAEQAIDVVAIFEPDGTFCYLSPSVEQVAGYSREDLEGTNGFDPVHPNDLDRLREAFAEALQDRTETVEVDGRYRHRDGSWRHLSIRGRQIEAESGEPQVLANVRDVTAQRRQQQQLREAKEKAEEASQLKSALLANMSHEIRTPLTSILGFSELLHDHDLDEPFGRFSGLIYESGKRLMHTLNSMLDLSRFEAGIVNTVVEPVGVSALMEDVTSELEGQARSAEVDLRTEATVHRVETDANVLRSMLLNLVHNAIKFSHQGGTVVVRAATDEAREEECGDGVVFSVIDTGIGMAPTFVDRAFNAFQQESTGATREYEGSGLGLTLVQRYADLIGATVEIDTEQGVGTTVSIRIPAR